MNMIENIDRTNPDIAKLRPATRDWDAIDKHIKPIFLRSAPLTVVMMDNIVSYTFDNAVDCPTLNIPTHLGTLPLPFTYNDIPIGKENDEGSICATIRRVAQQVEKVLINGMDDDLIQIRGLLSGLKPNEIQCPDDYDKDSPKLFLTMKQKLEEIKFYGPYGLFTNCRMFWDCIYPNKPDYIKDFAEVHGFGKEVDNDFVIHHVMFNIFPDTVRMVVGLKPIAIEWDGKVKIICCLVPQIREDFYKNTGVVWDRIFISERRKVNDL